MAIIVNVIVITMTSYIDYQLHLYNYREVLILGKMPDQHFCPTCITPPKKNKNKIKQSSALEFKKLLSLENAGKNTVQT